MLRVAIFLVGALFVTATFLTVRWGIADMHAQRAYDEMSSWKRGAEVDLSSWNTAHAELSSAISFDKKHPAYNQRMGVLYRTKIERQLVAADERAAVAALSARHFERSLAVRPRWGAAWADLAYLDSLLLTAGDEMATAIREAARWAPWEPYVISIVSDVGLAWFPSFDDATRDAVLNVTVNGLRSPAPGVYDAIRRLLEARPMYKAPVIERLLPHLIRTPWRTNVRLNYLLMVDWVWPLQTVEVRNELMEAALEMLARQARPENYVKALKNPNFKFQVCVRLPATEPIRVACR